MTAEGLHDYTSAAAQLGKSETWLRRNITRLPHLKIGRTVQFTDAHLAAVRQASEVIPAEYRPQVDLKPTTRRRSA